MTRSNPPDSDGSRGAENPQPGGPPEPKSHDALVFEHILWATPTCVRETLALLRAELTAICISRQSMHLIELLLAEALNNIVEHAYDGQEDGKISLRISRDGNRICLKVCDQGNPMPGGTLPPGRATELDVPRADLPEGGFGWFLIHSLAHQVDHVRSGQDNTLWITVDLDRLD